MTSHQMCIFPKHFVVEKYRIEEKIKDETTVLSIKYSEILYTSARISIGIVDSNNHLINTLQQDTNQSFQ